MGQTLSLSTHIWIIDWKFIGLVEPLNGRLVVLEADVALGQVLPVLLPAVGLQLFGGQEMISGLLHGRARRVGEQTRGHLPLPPRQLRHLVTKPEKNPKVSLRLECIGSGGQQATKTVKQN